jgi:3-oxoacyl-[acyl-carrier-protein] synthase III
LTKNIGIEAIEYYLPDKVTTSKELSELFDYDVGFIEDKIGVKNLYSSDSDGTTQLAVKALDKVLERFPNLRSEIELLVVCTQTPNYQLPQTSSQVQNICKLPNSIMAIDLNLGCSGFVYGLSIVESIMKNLDFKKAVLITAETYSHIINQEDRNTRCLFSDASAATLVSTKGKIFSGKYRFGSDGSFFDKLIVNPAINNGYLYMDGRAIYNFTSSTIADEIRKICIDNNNILDDIDYFVLHQASSYVIKSIAKRSNVRNEDRFIDYLDIFGNTVSSSIPIALKKLMNEKGRGGLKLAISGFGVGLSWGSTILETIKGVENV